MLTQEKWNRLAAYENKLDDEVNAGDISEEEAAQDYEELKNRLEAAHDN